MNFLFYSVICVLLFGICLGDDQTEIKILSNPCDLKVCELGEICKLNSNEIEEGKEPEVECVCDDRCDELEAIEVCDSSNTTWKSECHYNSAICQCRNESKDCPDKSIIETEVDYYGKCTEQLECPKNHLESFPERFTFWIYDVMNYMKDHKSLEEKYEKLLEKVTEGKEELKKENSTTVINEWLKYAVMWEFCELDENHVGHITSENYQMIKRSLKAVEHCIEPFLQHCDDDGDNQITESEWLKCLKIEGSNLDSFKTICSNGDIE
ncbi:hypothetical protein SNEBB_003766 [Seison nebaliae]|nr:hypothetical protein SNEBB_003766 [Seison nebaliae]